MKIVGLIMLFVLLVSETNTHTGDGQYRLGDLSSVVRCPLSVVPLSTTDNGLLTTDRQPKSAIQNPKSPEPWYERVLRRINPFNFDYGAWLEQRRAVFLEATVTNRFFWYSFWATAALIATILAYAKHRSDLHKFTWMSAGWLADFYNEMQFARDNADAAIEKYNQHIEKCNRAIESELDGSWKHQQTSEDVVLWQQKYEEVARLLDESATERKKLSTTLSERERTIADLSVRIEDLDQKIKGRPFIISGLPLTIHESNKLMVNRINLLERQLREEQNKNKSLRGS